MNSKRRLISLEKREDAILDWVIERMTDEELAVIAEQREDVWKVPGHPVYESFIRVRRQAERVAYANSEQNQIA